MDEQRLRELGQTEPTVLYDIFYEAGTRLGGTYDALLTKA